MSKFDWPAFVAALDTIRESRGAQWADIAKQSGVPASTLSRLARGKNCDIDSLAGLRQWMGVSIDKFFRLQKPQDSPDSDEMFGR